MTVEVQKEASGYEASIRQYFQKELPQIAIQDKNDLLEIIFSVLVGTKETRFGPIPPPEHSVIIRNVIRQAIESEMPIPILVPFGGIKADRSPDIDIAEFSAIRRLVNLNYCVTKYYHPGIIANVRIEDINALYLYGEEYRNSIENYSKNLSDLIYVLGGLGQSSIIGVKESDIITESLYNAEAEKWYRPILNYIMETNRNPDAIGKSPSYEVLVQKGWKGTIPHEQREFYMDRYKNLYPYKSFGEHVEMVARYLAGSKARHDLEATAYPKIPEIEGFIQINYTQPVPGAPSTMFNNALYYRTLPLSEARSHMPAWRSKGYLQINGESGTVKSKITNFNNTDIVNNLISNTIMIREGGYSIPVKADCLIV